MPDDATDTTQLDETLDEIRTLMAAGQVKEAQDRLSALHPADQADLIARLEHDERAPLLDGLPPDALADFLEYSKEDARQALVDALDPGLLAPILDRAGRDIAADVLRSLPPDRASGTLTRMVSAPDVAPLLRHPDESAGGRMTSDFVALFRDWTVDQALSYLRRAKPAAEQVFYLYVVDGRQRLEGVVSLRHLVVASADERIADLMTPEVMSVRTTDDQEEVARRIARYNFVALPVVDEENRLVGVVSVDDVLDVAEEEATEDMYRLAGLTEDESLLRPVGRSILPRLMWLVVALLSGFVSAGVVSGFEGTIERAAALAIFMPVIAGLGGNAGVQTLTLIVRSLALGTVELRHVRRILQRELMIGMANGVVIGVLLGLVAFAWQDNVGLGVVAGLAMLLATASATFAGVVVPVTLRFFRVDPALASGVLVFTVTDALGLFFFLGIAALLIERIA